MFEDEMHETVQCRNLGEQEIDWRIPHTGEQIPRRDMLSGTDCLWLQQQCSCVIVRDRVHVQFCKCFFAWWYVSANVPSWVGDGRMVGHSTKYSIAVLSVVKKED